MEGLWELTFHECNDQGRVHSHAMNISCALTTIVVAPTDALRKRYSEHLTMDLIVNDVLIGFPRSSHLLCVARQRFELEIISKNCYLREHDCEAPITCESCFSFMDDEAFVISRVFAMFYHNHHEKEKWQLQ